MSMQASYIAAAGTEAERKYTVFVVDDSADDRARALKELGKSPQVYNVHCFGNGDALMEHFAAHAFYNTPVMRSMPLLILL
ncbi:MAG: hypothetical protein KGQ70_08430, partial [Alphaproteobacteria bacterium]|nr:hypothetical protein [Alphaproteobacteria bacterium]